MHGMLCAKDIVKTFAGVEVLSKVNFELNEGEIHALLGENGAGKSTLMKIFMGEHQPDSGEIIHNGQAVTIDSPIKALEKGIAMVHQELHYMPYVSVADYICLGRMPGRFGFVNNREKTTYTVRQLENINITISPNALMGSLTVSQIQMVEIAKVLSYGSKVLILDEPTSSLTAREVKRLFEILKQLRSQGISIIYITHRLEELAEVADRVTILRDGCVVKTAEYSGLTKDDIVQHMIGRELEEVFLPKNLSFGDVALETKGFTKKGEFEDISIQVRHGEVVGLSGLTGAGRTEYVTALFGEKKIDAGELFLYGNKTEIRDSRNAIAKKIAFVTEDRKKYGLNLTSTVSDNLGMASMKNHSSAGFVSEGKLRGSARDMIRELSIRARGTDQKVVTLSGGNQQKVVLGKWMLTKPDVIIFDEPTRGIDVGAKSEIYRIIAGLANAGKAILLISSEMTEIIGLCNRVYVLHEGKMRGELRDSAEEAEISEQNIVNLYF